MLSDSQSSQHTGTGGTGPTRGLTSDVHLSSNVHGGRQVPHLDAAVAVAAKKVAARTRANAA